MIRDCIGCEKPFTVDEEVDARLRKRGPGHYQKVCDVCLLERLNDLAAESLLEMSDEEIRAELVEDGIDVDAYVACVRKSIDGCLKDRPARPAGGDKKERE